MPPLTSPLLFPASVSRLLPVLRSLFACRPWSLRARLRRLPAAALRVVAAGATLRAGTAVGRTAPVRAMTRRDRFRIRRLRAPRFDALRFRTLRFRTLILPPCIGQLKLPALIEPGLDDRRFLPVSECQLHPVHVDPAHLPQRSERPPMDRMHPRAHQQRVRLRIAERRIEFDPQMQRRRGQRHHRPVDPLPNRGRLLRRDRCRRLRRVGSLARPCPDQQAADPVGLRLQFRKTRKQPGLVGLRLDRLIADHPQLCADLLLLFHHVAEPDTRRGG
ncbi:MAG: hypothetical protein AB7O55_19435 [Lautropia sp.]